MTEPTTGRAVISGNQSKQAVGYAEKDLGLHTVYQDALEAHKTLEQIHEFRRSWARKKREITDQITDLEAEVISEERGTSTLSSTAFDKYIKGPLRNNADLQSLRSELITASENLEAADDSAKELTEQIHIKTARMEELGGYFSYLAAVRASIPTTPPEILTESST